MPRCCIWTASRAARCREKLSRRLHQSACRRRSACWPACRRAAPVPHSRRNGVAGKRPAPGGTIASCRDSPTVGGYLHAGDRPQPVRFLPGPSRIWRRDAGPRISARYWPLPARRSASVPSFRKIISTASRKTLCRRWRGRDAAIGRVCRRGDGRGPAAILAQLHARLFANWLAAIAAEKLRGRASRTVFAHKSA